MMTTNEKSTLSRTGIWVCAGLLLLAAGLILFLALQPAEQAKNKSAAVLSVDGAYQTEMEDRFSTILFGEVALKKKEYRISDAAAAAPVPDETCYGEAASPAELQWLVDKAAELLDGQKLYFTTDVETYAESPVYYYMDETIFAITWKQVIHDTVFTFSEVKLMHPSQFRRYLTGGEFGSGILAKSTEMSQTVNAVVACSADFYAYRRKGITVTNGVVNKYIPGVPDNCYIDRNGDMILERKLDFADTAEAQAYVDEHNINFSLSFGPILVKDGEYSCPKGYILGEVHKQFPRAAICQMDTLHYLFAAANMDKHYWTPLTMEEFAQCIFETGCRQAYALDGGQTATVVMNNTLMNNVNYGSERLISDIIYFATAKPAGE